MKKGHEVLRVGGIEVEVSNRDKLMFPADGITKGDLIAYYERVAPVILPYLRDRPLTMVRYPSGISEEGFFQKDIPDYFPEWVGRAEIRKENGTITQVVCGNAATLVYLANLACISTHVGLSRIDRLQNPDELIFDLDPADGEFPPVRKAAVKLRELLAETGLEAFIKTTGSHGVHVLIALDRSADFEQVRSFARLAALHLSRANPKEITIEQRKEKRAGRVYIDTLRNAYGQTAVSAYSVRARPGAPVSAPVEWEEIGAKGFDSRKFNIRNIYRRLDKKGDPWQKAFHSAFSLRGASARLSEIAGGDS